MSQLALWYLSHNDSETNASSLNNNREPDPRDIHFLVLAFWVQVIEFLPHLQPKCAITSRFKAETLPQVWHSLARVCLIWG